MISKVRERLTFAKIMLSYPFEMICEVIIYNDNLRFLTNPLDSIINHIAEFENLKKIAIVLSIEPNEENLDELFEAICSIYNEVVENNDFEFFQPKRLSSI